MDIKRKTCDTGTWKKNIYFSTRHSPILTQITRNRTQLLFSTRLKHGRHFDYWNQPQNMRMLSFFLSLFAFCQSIQDPTKLLDIESVILELDCHEAGLCCCLVIHIDNLLRPLQLFYFHLWPIYWLSFILIWPVLIKYLPVAWMRSASTPFWTFE
jgi:hypothetical protein